jgi:cytochrome P450
MFGADVVARAAGIGEALEATMDRYAARRGLGRFLPDGIPMGAGRRYVRGVREIDSFVKEIVGARRAMPNERPDLLAMLLAARDEFGNEMTAKQIRDEAITLFVGAFDTPALCLSWTWYLLSAHPEITAQLRAEVDHVLGDATPTAADFPRLPLTQRIIKESMRLYPPAWLLSREAAEDTTIGGIPVARGTSVLMSQWVTHRDERFFPRPDEFMPERWVDADSPKRFSYFPFGGGPRVCIGAAFATLETTLVLAMMAQRFRFEMAGSREVVPQPSMTLRPRGGVPARIVPRVVIRSPAVPRRASATV